MSFIIPSIFYPHLAVYKTRKRTVQIFFCTVSDTSVSYVNGNQSITRVISLALYNRHIESESRPDIQKKIELLRE